MVFETPVVFYIFLLWFEKFRILTPEEFTINFFEIGASNILHMWPLIAQVLQLLRINYQHRPLFIRTKYMMFLVCK